MSTQENSRTSLFLMELIICILFFALASAVCLRLFSSAYLLAEKNSNLNHALIWSQNFSESFYGCEGRILQMQDQFPDAFLTMADNETDGSLVLFFDNEWNQVDNSMDVASYEAVIVVRKDVASDVYSDVNTYGVELEGNAMTGQIAILDLRGQNVTFSDLPSDDKMIIYTSSVDTYIGTD
ncbi:MAG: hypothetical protein K6F75_10210 [Butyrivibrio sp.]|nr:hypothetical protein [Butyrivibrio sp.]